MDAERFDRLAKGLASGANRRGFIKGIAGAIVGVVGIGTRQSGAASQTNGETCSVGDKGLTGHICAAGEAEGDLRVGLCGVPNEGVCFTNNDCCSAVCVSETYEGPGVCRNRSEGTQGEVCTPGDQADCAVGFTCCDNYTSEGPDFFCTDTSSDPLNCGGCSQTGGVACSEGTPFCVNSTCSPCPSGLIQSPVDGSCIVEGTCPSGSSSECSGTNQVCCGEGTDKPGQCVGQGRDGGDRACYTGKRR